MLTSLLENDICRAGITALLQDILNGELPESARQLLLASRMIASVKPNKGLRPIAIGELFYRLAAVIAVKKVAYIAGKLLQPHQYGVGVSSGAERILHSLQHELTDVSCKRVLLKLDISNAFNSCDRARILRELYDTPELSSLYRMADFAYSAPTELLLEGCDGLSIQSTNGVRQGDPLSAVLFCLYLRKLLKQVADETGVNIYAFFDDINVTGTPEQVTQALTIFQRELPKMSLQCNTAKSHVAYFHDRDEDPLPRAMKKALADADIQIHDRWMETVGAIVGKDEDAIREGLANQLDKDSGRDAFFHRLTLAALTTSSAMQLLRQCAVPQLNYLLRCTPPSCIDGQAAKFDRLVQDAALIRGGISEGEASKEVVDILRAPLRKGAFGLTAATSTAPRAYLASMAAVSTAPAFDAYQQPDSIPDTTLLHGWIDDSMKRLRDSVLGDKTAKHIPCNAASFIHHFRQPAHSGIRSSLQTELSKLATTLNYTASKSEARSKKPMDGGWALAHLHSISTPHAWSWKAVVPSSDDLQLTDTEYRLAMRNNLGLDPGYAQPENCPNCSDQSSITDDPWHFLTCTKEMKQCVTMRHDAVVNALYRAVLAVGGQAVREPTGFGRHLRPDMRIVLRGQHIITDVAVVHPITPSTVKRGKGKLRVAKDMQQVKHRKYDQLAADQQAEFIPFVVETSGGMTPDAQRLLWIIAKAGEEQLGMWPKREVARQLTSAVAIAIQKGNAMTYLAGHSRAMAPGGPAKAKRTPLMTRERKEAGGKPEH